MKRLNKVLAGLGLGSRRGVEKLIFEGKISINGKVTLLPQTQVSHQDIISLEGVPLPFQFPKKVYFLLHKPVGYLCSNARKGKEKIIFDLVPQEFGRLFCIGRLDKLTSGLLLITNDGHLAHRIMHPSFEVAKEYLARVREDLSLAHLSTLSKGIFIDKTFIHPTKVVKVRNGTMKITVKEGKKHEIRLLIQAANLTLLELKRIRIGSIHLGALPPGSYRELKEKEIEPFLHAVAKKPKNYSSSSS